MIVKLSYISLKATKKLTFHLFKVITHRIKKKQFLWLNKHDLIQVIYFLQSITKKNYSTKKNILLLSLLEVVQG